MLPAKTGPIKDNLCSSAGIHRAGECPEDCGWLLAVVRTESPSLSTDAEGFSCGLYGAPLQDAGRLWLDHPLQTLHSGASQKLLNSGDKQGHEHRFGRETKNGVFYF